MQQLSRLIRLISEHSKQPLPLTGKWILTKGKETTLFEKIKTGEFTTDEVAAKELYNSTPKEAKYQMLKSRLEQKLLNHLFFIDFDKPGFKVSHKYEMECLDLLHQAKVLVKLHEFAIAVKLLNKVVKKAKEFEFTDIVVSGLDLLLFIQMTTVNEKSFAETETSFEKYSQLLIAENKAKMMATKAYIVLRKSVRSRKDYLPTLDTVLDQLRELWEETKSFNVFEEYYMLCMYKYELLGDFEKIIELTEESAILLRQLSINEKRFDIRFHKYMHIYALLQIKHYKKGLALAKECSKAFHPSNNNWFAFMENYFLLALHAKEYSQATKLINETITNPYFIKITERAKERWLLCQTYLYFAYPLVKAKAPANFQELVMKLPFHSQDKVGFNVAILILQFLYGLQCKYTEDLNCLAENLKKYVNYHLKDSLNVRSVLFIQLLILSIREGFDREQCVRKGQALYERLQHTSAPGTAYAEDEIIPYEQLWELILKQMPPVQKENVVRPFQI